jgi:hypothetical protein
MRSRAILITIAVLALTAAASGQPTVPSPTTGTASVRGRIVAADTGKPLRRVRISFSSPELGGPPRTANTNADGRYEIKDLPAGRYTVFADRSGYLQLRYGQRRPLETARPLQILDGQTIEHVDFALPRTGLITGHLTDEVGDAVAGATVFAMRSEYWMGRRQLVPSGPPARTDDTGQYRVIGLAPGTYFLRATTRETWTVTHSGKKDVMSFVPTFYPGTPDLKGAQRIAVGIGEHINDIDFPLVPGRTVEVSGTAFDSHGQPLANVMLAQDTLGPTGGTTGSGGNSAVAADGTFTIRNVAPGEYNLIAAGSGEVVRSPIVVAGANIDNVALIASAGWSATGMVETESGAPPDFPRERVRISVGGPSGFIGMHMQGEPAYRQDVNDDWTFSVSGIVGEAKFRVTLPDGWMVRSILHNGREVTDTSLEMKSGETLSGVQVIVTDRVTTVAGQLADGQGMPLIDGTIVVFSSDAEKWSEDSRFVRAVRPDQQGLYQVKGLPAGEYLAVALDYVQNGMWNDPEYLESIRRYAQKLTLQEGESRVISLQLAAR